MQISLQRTTQSWKGFWCAASECSTRWTDRYHSLLPFLHTEVSKDNSQLQGWVTHFLANRWQLGPSRPLGYPLDGCQSHRLLATSSIVVKTFGAAEMACAFSHPKSDILHASPHSEHSCAYIAVAFAATDL